MMLNSSHSPLICNSSHQDNKNVIRDNQCQTHNHNSRYTTRHKSSLTSDIITDDPIFGSVNRVSKIKRSQSTPGNGFLPLSGHMPPYTSSRPIGSLDQQTPRSSLEEVNGASDDSFILNRIIEKISEDAFDDSGKGSSTGNKWISSLSSKLTSGLSLSASWAGHSLGYNRSGNHSHQTTVFSVLPNGSLDFLKVPADEIAAQLTLIDLPIFKKIHESELTCIAWNTSKKLLLTPNVVHFTKRFNQISFWVVEEILLSSSKSATVANNYTNGNRVKRTPLGSSSILESEAKIRSDVLSYFIKVARKLMDLNNLHSCYAIISAITSTPIYRLDKTWSHVSKRDKQTLDRMSSLFSDESNFDNLRQHLSRVGVPCIPYLGMYLRDLVYVDIAHPASSGINGISHQRETKMNKILNEIKEFQKSSYPQIEVMPTLHGFLTSVRYIEELQKFLEEDNYKMSLKLEPPASQIMKSSYLNNSSSSPVSKKEKGVSQSKFYLSSTNSSPVSHSKSQGGTSNSMPGAYGKITPVLNQPFQPTHRKAKSLGSNIILDATCSRDQLEYVKRGSVDSDASRFSINYDSVEERKHLIDDSVIEESYDDAPKYSLTSKRPSLDFISGNVNRGFSKSPSFNGYMSCAATGSPSASSVPRILGSDEVSLDLSSGGVDSSDAYRMIHGAKATFEGYVKRKTLVKDGNKPALSAWIRYWIELKGSMLLYYPSRSLRGSKRDKFVSNVSKSISLNGGWTAGFLSKTDSTFVLSDASSRNVYKFKVKSPEEASQWIRHITLVSKTGADKLFKTRNRAMSDTLFSFMTISKS